MIKKSANIILSVLFFCAFFMSFSQDDGLTLLDDADDKQIKFENHYFEALKYKAIGNYSKAIIELEICQDLFKDNNSIIFELSKNYYLLNKFSEAQLYLDKVLKKEPDNYWYLEHAKNIYLRLYQLDNAITIQKKMISLNPKVAEDMIPLYIRKKEYQKAIKYIGELESNGLTSSKLLRYRELIELNTKRIVTKKELKETEIVSLTKLKEQFESGKKYTILEKILTEELNAKNFDNLLIYSNKGLDLFPAQPSIYLMNSYALSHQKKYSEAIDVLNTGIDFVFDDSKLLIAFHQQLAKCYQETNQTNKEQEHLKTIEELRTKKNQ